MSYVQLTPQERYVIYHLHLFGLSLREIGRRLQRHHSTILRELRRNRRASWGSYWHEAAQARALECRRRVRHHRRRSQAALYRYVVERLRAHWSPECIAGRIVLDHPDEHSMRVSPETIYRWIYREARAGGQLYRCLCRRHPRRRRQRRYGSLRGLLPGRVSIHERPIAVAHRRRFGDWEGDTVYGRGTRHCLLTQVERKSRWLMPAASRIGAPTPWRKVILGTCPPCPYLGGKP